MRYFCQMKYRLLNDEELQILEEELKQFLIVNGIDGSIWLEINKNEPQKALGLIQLFSDQVLQCVYEKIEFLEKRSPQDCLIFHIAEYHIDLIALQAQSEELNLSDPEGIHQALTTGLKKMSIFKSRKSIQRPREEEIHILLTQGCVHSDKAFWEMLNRVIQ